MNKEEKQSTTFTDLSHAVAIEINGEVLKPLPRLWNWLDTITENNHTYSVYLIPYGHLPSLPIAGIFPVFCEDDVWMTCAGPEGFELTEFSTITA